jgi:SAM-dependent methyltransferase
LPELLRETILEIFHRKYGPTEKLGWGPRMRLASGYFTPDDVYEATVATLVEEGSVWLDVGCGRDIFPSNPETARVLSQRCKLLAGLDPSDNIDENPFIQERFKGFLEEYDTPRRFDLITLRMVAEHIAKPKEAVAALARLCKPGGRVVIYTVYRWSPITMVSSVAPFALHHPLKKILWSATEEKDTFPTAYKMNTRHALKGLLGRAGFEEEEFRYLDDCRSLAAWKLAHRLELGLWKLLHAVDLPYPELCLMGVYRREAGVRQCILNQDTQQ